MTKLNKRQQEILAHPLAPVFMAAIEQAMFGKGERHGGAVTPFLEQPWVHYSKMHGRGFLTGQASKKLESNIVSDPPVAFPHKNVRHYGKARGHIAIACI